MRRLARPIVVVGVGLWALSAVGCGGSAKPAESGGAAAPTGVQEPTTETETKAEPALVPPALVSIEARVTKAQTELDDAQAAFTAAGGDCASLCKALASMIRATDHLCELAKESGDPKRCDDAKGRLDAAQGKVKSTCGVCG